MKRKCMVASLEYGRCFSLFMRIFIIVIHCFAMACIPLLIIEKMALEEVICVAIVIFIIFAFCIWFEVVSFRIVKIYKKCLKDGVMLRAKSVITDRSNESLGLVRSRAVRIKVTFYINGKQIVKRSGEKGYKQIFDGSKKAGYDNVFYRYGDREINILYSEKYNHVFILKD